MASVGLSPFRIEIYGVDSSARGPGTLRGIIEDASDIGCSTYANDIGEMFFTLPMQHPLIDAIEPLETHYAIRRLNASGSAYDLIHVGMVEDYDATADEVVFYGHDYLGFLAKSILPSTTSFTSTLIGTIINNTWTARKAATNSPLGFVGTGTIDATSRTVTVTAPFEEQLSFYSGLCEILAGAGTTRPMVGMTLSAAPSFYFDDNKGQEQASTRLVLGGQILDFRFSPGLSDLRTENKGIGVKREGATVLYSSQTVGSPSTYGDLEMVSVYTDLINQTELNSKTLATAKDAYFRSQRLYISLAQGHTKPLDGWDIGDHIRISIERGIVSIVDAWYTVWGWEWIGRKDGSESLFLDVQPTMT